MIINITTSSKNSQNDGFFYTIKHEKETCALILYAENRDKLQRVSLKKKKKLFFVSWYFIQKFTKNFEKFLFFSKWWNTIYDEILLKELSFSKWWNTIKRGKEICVSI